MKQKACYMIHRKISENPTLKKLEKRRAQMQRNHTPTLLRRVYHVPKKWVTSVSTNTVFYYLCTFFDVSTRVLFSDTLATRFKQSRHHWIPYRQPHMQHMFIWNLFWVVSVVNRKNNHTRIVLSLKWVATILHNHLCHYTLLKIIV